MAVAIEDKLYTTKFRADEVPHLIIKDTNDCLRCRDQQCTYTCPARCYTRQEDGTVVVAYEGCVECGTCRVVCCEFENIDWRYPTGGFGVIYRYG